MIKIEEHRISPKDFNYLTDMVGWGTREEKIVEEALQHTCHSVCAFDEEDIIGYGRLIGDQTIFLYIQDVMVLPAYQNQKIGTEIMGLLVSKIQEYKKYSPDIRTYLGASKGKEGFYKNFGFITREEADLGPGMVLF